MSHAPGDVLNGTYRLDALIGRGGMGEVHAATHLVSGQDVAIKLVHREHFDETLRARLRREAEAAARVQSAFAPRLLEVAETGEGELFLVMERLHGESLGRRLRERTALSWDEVRVHGEDILRGLIDAHTAGVIHRDLKPGNVFLASWEGERERAMILDFGICKLDTHDAEHLTETGEALGTIAYMAPEQIRGAARVDERADLYSWGMVVFEMLTGRLAHEAQGQVALIASKLENPARKLSDLALVPIPAALDALVSRALARRPADRFASAQELLKAWRALGAATVLPRAVPPSPESLIAQTRGARTAGTLTRHAGGRGARLWMLVAVATLGVGCLAIIGVVVGIKARTPHVDGLQAPAQLSEVAAFAPSTSGTAPAHVEKQESTIELGPTPPVASVGVPPRGGARLPRSDKKVRPKGAGGITEEPRY